MGAHETIVVRDETGQPRYRVGKLYLRGRIYWARIRNIRTGRLSRVSTEATEHANGFQAALDWCAARIREGTEKASQTPSF